MTKSNGSQPLAYQYASTQPAASTRLIDAVAQACRRLSAAGWAELFACHGLDIGVDSADLAAELVRPIPVDRSQPGFADFALEGERGIEPGNPGTSLVFHAFASPDVRSYRSAQGVVDLMDFPTLAEIEAVENYVFGVFPPTVDDLRARCGGASLAIVVFACEYRTGEDTAHRRHADMCYSRAGISRVGMRPPDYDGAFRSFRMLAPGDSRSFAVLPARYAAYVAALVPGAKDRHGPMHFVEAKSRPAAGSVHVGKDAGVRPFAPNLAAGETSDADRQFWIPMHKLFDGPECLQGLVLAIGLAASHCNEKLRRAHLFFGSHGHDGGWHEPALSQHPFLITKDIAELSERPEHGAGLVVPNAHPRLVEPAEYKGEPLTYKVPPSNGAKPWELYHSSLNLVAVNQDARRAPEYLHARHVIDGKKEKNLNKAPDMLDQLADGEFWARHYIDFTGDGWIGVECEALALEIPRRLSAYSIIACPDYFPDVRQSDLIAWTDRSVPPALLQAIWPENPGRPEPLSAQRYAANLELKDAGFDPNDDTMTAIVGLQGSGGGRQTRLTRPGRRRISMLPDGAAGVFAPGWDVSFDRTAPNPSETGEASAGIAFLNNYGLGSPFPEDAMLCAALSSFWPAVAPDIARTFAPTGRYHSATPLTDKEIGLDGGTPWDGVEGPRYDPKAETVDYPRLAYGDYVEAALEGRFDLSALALITPAEYVARTLTMAMVYESLGVRGRFEKSKWAVLSFRRVESDDPDLDALVRSLQRRLNPSHTYRFEMIRHDNALAENPSDFSRALVKVAERVILFADPVVVLRGSTPGRSEGIHVRHG